MSNVTLITMPKVLIACLLASPAQGAARYTVTVLDPPSGALGATPLAINDGGQTVGVMFTPDRRAFLYENGGLMRDLGSLSANASSAAYAINSHGQIAGDSQVTTYAQHAVLFSSDGSVQDLGTLGGSVSHASGINDLGQVVGGAALANGQSHAFVYTQKQGMQDLGTLGGSGGTAHAINNAGTVVGHAYLSGMSAYHAFRYTAADGMRDLGTLGGQNSVANDINTAGQIVGYSDLSSTPGVHHAALWNSDGSLTDLGSLSSYYSEANAINDAGLVVGVAQMNAQGVRHAFLWNGSAMLDLNDLIDPMPGRVLYGAADINSSGQIVVAGSLSPYNGLGAFLLTPVPDPATLILLSAGLLGILARPRRGRRRSMLARPDVREDINGIPRPPTDPDMGAYQGPYPQ
jgi:probable HAF family extracellular repeat protein